MPAIDIEFEKLKNNICALVLLSHSHCEELVKAASDGELWNLEYATIPQPGAMRAEITRRLELMSDGVMVPFSVIHNESQKLVGMTTYCKINSMEKKLDIGWTWYAKSYQRTAINTNCKLLLLSYAFETLQFEEVYFKVHVKNFASQAAVLRLGANYVGIIKNYQTMPNKKAQNYYHYSIDRATWPRVKMNLTLKTVRINSECIS